MIPKLDNWSFGFLDNRKYPMPITGDVSGHIYFSNGENIQTSPVVDVFLLNGNVFIKTINDSRYILEKPTERFIIYSNIVKQFPEKYMSISSDEMNFNSNKNTVTFLRWFLSLD